MENGPPNSWGKQLACPTAGARSTGERGQRLGPPGARRAGGAGEGAGDEELVPEVVAQQTVKKPVGPGKANGQRRPVEEIVWVDPFDPGAELPARRHPLEDRLAEPQFAPVDEVRGQVTGQGTLE